MAIPRVGRGTESLRFEVRSRTFTVLYGEVCQHVAESDGLCLREALTKRFVGDDASNVMAARPCLSFTSERPKSITSPG